MFGSGGIIQIVLDVVEVVKVGKKQTNILTSTAILPSTSLLLSINLFLVITA